METILVPCTLRYLATNEPDELTPWEIVAELDKYIIGQSDAKKNVAIALRNRWRRRNAPEEMRDEIIPNNIIMIGPTGVGKTEIARRLAKLAGAPFIKVEATKFTEVGYVGRDVDSMIRDLMDIAVNMVRKEQAETVQDRAQELANECILDILLPEPKKPDLPAFLDSSGFSMHPPKINGGQEAGETTPRGASLHRTREKFRKKLMAGELEDREIEVEVSPDTTPVLQFFGPMGLEEMGINLQDMFGHSGGQKSKKRRVTIGEGRTILTRQEANKLIDMERVKKEAIERVQNSGIVFIDEIDKVAVRRKKEGGLDVSREGVQRDLLPMVEGSNVMTKYGMVKTDHILFIASGAFHVSKPSDLIPEMQGRFPIRVEPEEPHRGGFLQNPHPAQERTDQAIQGPASLRRRLHRIHRPGRAAHRLRRRQGERGRGEHRCSPASHHPDHAPGERAVRHPGTPAIRKVVIDEAAVEEKLGSIMGKSRPQPVHPVDSHLHARCLGPWRGRTLEGALGGIPAALPLCTLRLPARRRGRSGAQDRHPRPVGR